MAICAELLMKFEISLIVTVYFADLDNKPKRLLRNIPAQHLYLRMATTPEGIADQLEKIKAVELQHLFLASSKIHAEDYLGIVCYLNL